MIILHIFGARPQFVKTAMLAKAWKGKCEQLFLHTGQHYNFNLSDSLLIDLGMREPDINLGIGSASPAEQTARMMIGIETYIQKNDPDCVVVYGDTNSTLAGAMVASKMDIPLVHIEAGLRSFNRKMPEEINRIVTDHVSDLLFCPTKTSQENLQKEGITNGVFLSGDVMADALEFYKSKLNDKESLLKEFKLKEKRFLLLTLHRQGNVDSREKLNEIVMGLKEIPETILFPIHPRTKKMLNIFQMELPVNVIVIPPLDYTKLLLLEQTASAILTDSGGIQKEAYLMGTPCITLRDETEWVETVQTGWNILVGADRKKIVSAYNNFHPAGKRPQLYGNYHAAEMIAEKTVEWMKENG